MANLKVAVLMGSDSDYPIVKTAVDILKELDIPYEVRVMSAHRTPCLVEAFASSAKEKGFGVLIAAAGKAAHLAGVIASYSTLPTIGIPVSSSAFGGLDALLSTVQMPKGIPVATVAVDCAENAALLAAQILGVKDEELAKKIIDKRKQMEQDILKKDAKIMGEHRYG
jgi:5-(carboxyamino)imidazole ribonucleotide mutase